MREEEQAERARRRSDPAAREAVPAGDERARFGEVYNEHAGRIFALCLRMIGDGDVAADVSQEVFLHAWRNFGTFRGDARIGTWLHRIAIRRVANRMRSDRRYRARVITNSELTAYTAVVARSMPETRIDLERAIAGLPDGARAVLILYDIEGYPYDEIAALLEVSIGTVRSQLHRARRLLRDALRASDGE